MSRRARLLAFAALFVLAVVALQLPETQVPAPSPPSSTATRPPTSTPPPLVAAQLDQQDRVGRLHRRRETLAFDRRPLLSVLPLELAGVGIEIAGLAADGRTTILRSRPVGGVGGTRTISTGGRSRPTGTQVPHTSCGGRGDHRQQVVGGGGRTCAHGRRRCRQPTKQRPSVTAAAGHCPERVIGTDDAAGARKARRRHSSRPAAAAKPCSCGSVVRAGGHQLDRAHLRGRPTRPGGPGIRSTPA